MSHAGAYYKTGKSIFRALEEGKPHTSITDWIEVLSSDRYDELSLDGIPELVESINILGSAGTAEGARAIRKKLKYGNVHRQIRALVILRALTENAGKGFKLNWADDQILGRLRDMAQDSLLDPKVKKRLILVFHAWSIQYQDEPRMRAVAGLYKQYAPHAAGPDVRKATQVPSSPRTSVPAAASKPRGAFDDDDLYNHSWAPAAGQRGKDTYADLAAAKADAEQRRAEREARLLIEQREAEVERRERELRRKQEMAAIEARRQREAEEEAARRRKMKEDAARAKATPQPKKPKFDLQREKPQIMVSVANALQAATSLVAACRHINREYENVTESPKVQDCLDKAKAARRVIIRYLQLVMDETIVGTLIEANEKIVEAIQLYDRLSKPAILDSDDEGEHPAAAPPMAKEPSGPNEMELLTRRMEAQKLEADRRGEIQRLQETQKRESAKQQARRAAPKAPTSSRSGGGRGAHPDLQDLDFGSISSRKESSRLPPPMSPDSDAGSFRAGSLSDFSDYSDYGYDSSDPEDRRGPRSRRPSHAAGAASASHSRRGSVQYGHAGASGTGSRSRRQSMKQEYRSLDDDNGKQGGRTRLLDPSDPFGDPFADDGETPQQEKRRMQWAEI